VARWQPGAPERLRASALELFCEHGYDQTTVAEIAHRAGLTERTFYRHFADKREVLFQGGEVLRNALCEAVSAAPEGAGTRTLIDAALAGVGSCFPPERRAFARDRAVTLAAEPALQERELLKLADLKRGLAEAYVRRGLVETQAALAAETVMSVFHMAFQRWIAEGEERELPELQRAILAELHALTAA
jgi:AcrR family transcriptional regulator